MIKGKSKQLYVGKTESNILDFWGNKTNIPYESLKRIDYFFANKRDAGRLSFVKKTNEEIKFEFTQSANDSILRTIDFIYEHMPELPLNEIELVSTQGNISSIRNPINESEKRSKPILSFFFATIAILVIIYIVGNNNSLTPVLPTESDNKVQDNTNNEISLSETEELEETSIFNVGDVFESDKLKIMYLDSGDYETSNEFMQPESGNKFIYVDFSIENVSDSDYSVGSVAFDCYADDTECSSSITDIAEKMTSITTLSPGRNTKGRICYEVPINASNIEIEFETSFWTQDKIYFIVE